MSNTNDRYSMAFTVGGLLVQEALRIVPLRQSGMSWGEVHALIVETNLFQTRTSSTNARLARESVQRVRQFDDLEWALFSEASLTEQSQLMWVAACRRYRFIGEFAEEVLRERFLLLGTDLGSEEFNGFFVGKSLWHSELTDLKLSTRTKLRQNLFRMLREAGFLESDGKIVPAVLSGRLLDVLHGRTPSDIRFFPTTISAEA